MKSIIGPAKRILGIVLIGTLLVSGCGQKGPLVLPDAEKQDKTDKKRSN